MNKGLLACFALAFFCATGKASAQFNDARAYDNTPVRVSQLELDYTYVRAPTPRWTLRSLSRALT
ncbi:MAG TPA: hypothetical protein VGF61_13925 [Candidatus Acidoferrum sp.]